MDILGRFCLRFEQYISPSEGDFPILKENLILKIFTFAESLRGSVGILDISSIHKNSLQVVILKIKCNLFEISRKPF